jgi:hypothetical protein
MTEYFGKGNTLEQTKRIVTGETVARYSGTSDATKEAGQGTLGAQGGMTLGS